MTIFTSIKLSSGDLTGRKTNFILGQHLDISSFTIFDLCADRLSSTTKMIGYPCHTFYLLFLESQQTVSLSYFYSIVHASYHWYGRTLQTHLVALLSFDLFLSLPVLITKMYHHEFWRLLALSHLHTVTQNLMVCCTSLFNVLFFKASSGSLLLFDKTVLDLPFYFMLQKDIPYFRMMAYFI